MENTTANAIANAITDALNGKKGQMGINCTYRTEPKMRKTNNPYFGRVEKQTTATNARFGVDYENAVNGKLEKEGLTADFIKGASMTDYVNAFINESHDKTKHYLKLGGNSSTKFHSEYFVDGRKATDAELAEIETFLQVSKPSQKQINAGLQPSDTYIHITINVDNIIEISQGNKTLFQSQSKQLLTA